MSSLLVIVNPHFNKSFGQGCSLKPKVWHKQRACFTRLDMLSVMTRVTKTPKIFLGPDNCYDPNPHHKGLSQLIYLLSN